MKFWYKTKNRFCYGGLILCPVCLMSELIVNQNRTHVERRANMLRTMLG
jgi:hypothetical protein